MDFTQKNLFDRLGAAPKTWAAPLSGGEEFEDWQRRARERLRALLVLPETKGTSAPRKISEEVFPDHVRERWVMETEPGVFMPFYLLVPAAAGVHPAAVALHGHGFGAKEGVAGNRGNAVIARAADAFGADYGLRLVRAGFLTAVPDARGFGERREESHRGEEGERVLEHSCTELSRLAAGMGRTLPGMFVFDVMCLADFLTARKDGCGLSCVGLSGGGMQTLLFSALDGRVKNAVISGYYYGAKKALFDMPQCACNYAPGLWRDFDMCDIGALIAPRGLFVETGDADPLNGGLDNALAMGEATKKNYACLGVQDNFIQRVYRGGHRFYGEHSIDWLTERVKIQENLG